MSCNNTFGYGKALARYDVNVKKGNTWTATFELNNVDDAGVKTPISLATADVRIQIRKAPSSTTAELTMTESGGGITVGGANNNQIVVSKDIPLAAREYAWDCLITFATGVKKTYFGGSFTVYDEVTEP